MSVAQQDEKSPAALTKRQRTPTSTAITTTTTKKVVILQRRSIVVGQSSSKSDKDHGSPPPIFSSLSQRLQLVVQFLLVCLLGGLYQCGPSLLIYHWRLQQQQQQQGTKDGACHNSILNSIQVWDDVLSESTMQELRLAFKKHRPPENSTTVAFPWSPLTTASELARRNPIEQILSHILTQLYNNNDNEDPYHSCNPQTNDLVAASAVMGTGNRNTTIDTTNTTEPRFWVEYWDRQHWMSIAAHADQDEGSFNKALELGIEAPPIRHALFGHVLYLEQGPEAILQAPTLVFANVSTGGEMVYQRRSRQSSSIGENEDFVAVSSIEDVELLVVPNRPSRLLRFPGHWLHSVPRPANLYMQTYHGNLPKNAPRTYPLPTTIPVAEKYRRSVVLFNLWHMDEPPTDIPMTVPIVADNHTKNNHSKEEQGEEEGESVSTSTIANASGVFPRHEWKKVSVSSDWEGNWIERFLSSLWLPGWTTSWPFDIPLMGVRVQRGMLDDTVHLKASASVYRALTTTTTTATVTTPRTEGGTASTTSRLDPHPKRLYLQQPHLTWNKISKYLQQQPLSPPASESSSSKPSSSSSSSLSEL